MAAMSFKLGLALGMAAGIVVGLATAPRPGRETRRKLASHLPHPEGALQGNGQATTATEIPTIYQSSTEGDPPTLYKSEEDA
jgi:gas vesicle protein